MSSNVENTVRPAVKSGDGKARGSHDPITDPVEVAFTGWCIRRRPQAGDNATVAEMILAGLGNIPDGLNKTDPAAAWKDLELLVPVLARVEAEKPGFVSTVAPILKSKLGVSLADLRERVRVHLPEGVKATGKDGELQGKVLTLPEFEPWPEAVDGAAVLDDLVAAFKHFVILPEHGAEAAALWVFAIAHGLPLGISDFNPPLTLTSATMRCGKSRLIELLAPVVPRPVVSSNVSEASLYRVIAKYKPTVIIDEIDRIDPRRSELWGLINASNTRGGAYTLRCVGEDFDPRLFSTWAPLVLSGIGRRTGTVMDRSIVLKMRRRAPGESIGRLTTAAREELHAIGRRVARWMADHADTLRGLSIEGPAALDDRAADNWGPLMAVASLAGGKWPERAKGAALALSGPGTEEDAESLRETLLADLHGLFHPPGGPVEQLATSQILAALAIMDERPWPELMRGDKPITSRRLAFLLKPFGVGPRTIRTADGTPKGYRLEDLKDTFLRWIPPPGGSQSATTPQINTDGPFRENPSATRTPNVADRNLQKPAPGAECCGVAVRNPPEGVTGELFGPETPEERAELDRQAGGREGGRGV